MDVSPKPPRTTKVPLVLTAAFIGATVFFFPKNADAYNPFTHDQITRSALIHLRTHANVFEETTRWMNGEGNQGLLDEAVTRAAVDHDYQTDTWFDAWFHDPFTGAKSGNTVAMFTRLGHFLTVPVRGDYWEYDGYAPRHTNRKDNDGYLDYFSLEIRGDLSRALGGSYPRYPGHGVSAGPYKSGFKGSEKAWRNLFYEADAEDVVFPPASVPAQQAFDAMIKSGRADSDATESWTERLPLVSGIFSTAHLSRHYWRGEVKGLPKGISLIGTILHLVQDLSVPQHALGTCDWCHQELEDLADQLNCNISYTPSNELYDNGGFGGDPYPNCRKLYDPELVEHLRTSYGFLDARNQQLSMGDRMLLMAKESAHWQWGAPRKSRDSKATILPDGTMFTGNKCSQLINHEQVRSWLKFQYNMAVAFSATAIEVSANSYEAARSSYFQRIAPSKLFNFFQIFNYSLP